MRVNKFVLPIAGVLLIVATIGGAMATGHWVTSGRQLTQALIEKGELSAEDIKGWMTLEQISQWYGVPLDYLSGRLGISTEKAAQVAAKDLEDIIPDFETSDLREIVAEYLEAPAPQQGSPAGYLEAPPPEQASPAEHLEAAPPERGSPAKSLEAPPAQQGSPTKSLEAAPTQQGSPAKSLEALPPQEGDPEAPAVSGSTDHQPSQFVGAGAGAGEGFDLSNVTSPDEIRGRMTLDEVCNTFGFSLSDLLKRLGIDEPISGTTQLKTLSEERGIEVSVVREVVAEMLAEKGDK